MNRPALDDIKVAAGVSLSRDPVDGAIVLCLHDADRRVFAAVALPLTGALTLNEQMTAACRRGAVELAAGPSPSEGIH